MSIEHIRDYIIGHAQKEAEHIIKSAEEQYSERIEEIKQSLEKQYSEMLLSDEKILTKEVRQHISSLKRMYQMKLLEMKNRLIDTVFERAINSIQSLPDNEYMSLMERFLKHVPRGIEGEIFFNARDLKRLTDDFIDKINKSRNARFVLNTTPVDIKGGFIIKTARYEIDYTLDTIVKNLRMNLIPELCKILNISHVTLD